MTIVSHPLLEKLDSPFKEFAEANLRRTTKLTLSAPTGEISPISSRTGNTAVVTPQHPWPLDSTGAPMQHVAQLNLAELPAREGMPTEGLLQFFIAVDDSMGRTNTKNPGYQGSVVRLIPANELDAGVVQTHEHPNSSFSIGEFTISGSLYDQAPHYSDYQFAPFAEQAGIYTQKEDFLDSLGFYDKEEFADCDEEDVLEEHGWVDPIEGIGEVCDHYAHLFLGGWTQHPQYDPRDDLDCKESPYFHPHFRDQDMQLLLQLSSYTDEETRARIDIGHDGILHFFLGDKDLSRLDFSMPLYSYSMY